MILITTKVTRISVSLEPELLEPFDELIAKKGYISRSEAVRDAIRHYTNTYSWKPSRNKRRVAVISILYDHRKCPALTGIQHSFENVVAFTTHVHMKHHKCLEILVAKGNPEETTRLADRLQSTKGVENVTLDFVA